MKVKRIRETTHTTTYVLTSPICKASIKISKSRFPRIHSYMERGVKFGLPCNSMEELGDIFISLQQIFGEKGIYTGVDFLNYIGCNLNPSEEDLYYKE